MKRFLLFVLAIVSWIAVVIQIVLTTHNVVALGHSVSFGIVKALSYFTVLTNLLVAIVTTASLAGGDERKFLTRASTMTATAVYIAVVGLIYSLVLRSLWEPTGLQLATDIALHDVVPVLYVSYWLFFVSGQSMDWRAPVWWLSYPVAYVAWTLVRGAVAGDYPYPFADVGKLGYPSALLNAALILVGFLALGLLTVALDRFSVRLRARLGAALSGSD